MLVTEDVIKALHDKWKSEQGAYKSFCRVGAEQDDGPSPVLVPDEEQLPRKAVDAGASSSSTPSTPSAAQPGAP